MDKDRQHWRRRTAAVWCLFLRAVGRVQVAVDSAVTEGQNSTRVIGVCVAVRSARAFTAPAVGAR